MKTAENDTDFCLTIFFALYSVISFLIGFNHGFNLWKLCSFHNFRVMATVRNKKQCFVFKSGFSPKIESQLMSVFS